MFKKTIIISTILSAFISAQASDIPKNPNMKRSSIVISAQIIKEALEQSDKLIETGKVCNRNDVAKSEGMGMALEKMEGSFQTTSLSNYGGTGVQKTSSWTTLAFTYGNFICSLNKEERENLFYFLHARAEQATYDAFIEANSEKINCFKYSRFTGAAYIPSMKINHEAEKKEIEQSEIFLIDQLHFFLLITNRVENPNYPRIDSEKIYKDENLKKFVGALLKKDYKSAKMIINNDPRVKETKAITNDILNTEDYNQAIQDSANGI